MPTIQKEVNEGATIQVGDVEITPLTQVLKVQLPGQHAGVIWNRPKAVRVKMPDGVERLLPVRDVTRLAIWSMLIGGLVGAIFIKLMYHKD